MTAKQHAQVYGVPIERVRQWRRNSWPLDDVESIRKYLAFKEDMVKAVFGDAKGKALRVIGFAAKDADGDRDRVKVETVDPHIVPDRAEHSA